MATDTFICGICNSVFHDITLFVQHKNIGCENTENTIIDKNEDVEDTMTVSVIKLENENYEILSDERTETQHQEIHTQPPTSHAENEHISQQIHIIQNEDQISGQDLGELGPHQYIIQEKSNNIAIPSQHIILKQENVVGSDPPNQIIVQGQLPEYVQIVSGDDIQQGHLQIVEQVINNEQQYVQLEQSTENLQELEDDSYAEQQSNLIDIKLVPVPAEIREDGTENTSAGVDYQVLVGKAANMPEKVIKRGTGRRRGRPRKGEEKKKTNAPPTTVEKKIVEKPTTHEKGVDGQYHCGRCKKTFKRERHVMSHKCLAHSDYVDITKRELVDELTSGDESEDEKEDRSRNDDAKEYRAYGGVSKRGRGRGSQRGCRGNANVNSNKQHGVVSITLFPDDEPSGSIITSKREMSQSVAVPVIKDAIPGCDFVPENDITQGNEEAMSIAMDITSVGGSQEDGDDRMSIGVKTAHSVLKDQDVSLSDALEGANPKPSLLAISKVDDMERKTVPDEREENQETAPDKKKIPGRRGRRPQDIVLSSDPPRTIDKIPSLPVFLNEEDKVEFEQRLNVDLTGVDSMWQRHAVPQELNDQAPPSASRTQEELSLYACTVCDKVFMSMSHARLHCLTHTDVRPFRCHKCEYGTNTRGNLYSHMRWHTGQVYRCRTCSFATANKAHLVEHEPIHSSVRHKCDLCKKDYNTEKSLVNHVRRSHGHTKTGEKYLKGFSTNKRNQGPTMLHQCHVCNRKFKKKTDRDRHLFVHNVRSNPSHLYICEVCSYATNRRGYLAKHYRKHRVMYVCDVCQHKYPSSIRLNQHLADQHVDAQLDKARGAQELDNLLIKSLDCSMFLPEASGVFENWNHDDTDLVTLEESPARQGQDQTVEKSEVSEMENIARQPIEDEDLTNEDASISNLPNETLFGEASDEDPAAVIDSGELGLNPSTAGNENIEPCAIPATGVVNEGEQGRSMNMEEFYQQIGYRKMGQETYQKLLKTFGSEECEYCGRLFYAKSDFETHMRTHTGEKPFACDQCEYHAITKDNLKRHIEREHDRVMYKCSECDFSSEQRTKLWMHQQQQHRTNEFECHACQQSFENLKRLKVHLQVKHWQMSLAEALKLTSAPNKSHSKIGKKSYMCPYCDRTFLRSSTDLQKHMWIHEGVKPFKCTLCSHATRSKTNLQSHMLRHSADKPFLCTHCGKAYKSRTALRWHVRSHKDGKLFKCTKCPYEASQKSHLKRHSETHDIVKRFICEHCDYSANTIGYMKIHYTRNHKGQQYTQNPAVLKTMASDAKVYRCLSCDYLFGNLPDMKRHLKVRHHMQLQEMAELETSEVVHAEVTGELATVPVEVVIQGQSHPHIQVVQVGGEEDGKSADEQTQEHSGISPGENVNKASTSATFLQQIIDMSKQGAFNRQQTITVQSADGQNLVTVNPEITLQPGMQEVVVGSDKNQRLLTSNDDTHMLLSGVDDQMFVSGEPPGQYVIQYVTEEGHKLPQELEVSGNEVIDNVLTHTEMDTTEVVQLNNEYTHQQITAVSAHDSPVQQVQFAIPDDDQKLSGWWLNKKA